VSPGFIKEYNDDPQLSQSHLSRVRDVNEDNRMTAPAVVILTDPARCELGDADVLLKALLQVQQLGNAGVPASQAFCDHPAAAREFIDAYSKIYPELQQQSSDLPLPEHLYSMVADGRFGPLVTPTTGETAKPAEAAQLYPLYVLSLGAPEALLQALQHNSLAKNNIRILEITPVEPPNTEFVPVSEAVTSEPVARSSWLEDSSSARQNEIGDASPLESLSASEPLKLDGVEVNLDDIQGDTNNGQTGPVQNVSTFDTPAPAIVHVVPVGPVIVDAGGRPSHAGETTPAGNVGAASAAVQLPPVAVVALEPVQETHNPSPIEPSGVIGPGLGQTSSPPLIDEVPPPASPTDHGQSPGSEADPLETPTTTGQESGMQPDATSGDQSPVVDDGVDDSPPSNGLPDPAEVIAASDPTIEEEAGASHASYADPGEDVHYPPAGNFAGGNDLPYALPAEHVPDAELFEGPIGLPTRADVVDLEALFSDLGALVGASSPVVEEFDFSLLRALQSGGPHSGPFSSSGQNGPAPPQHDTPDGDPDDAHHETLTTIHDTDL
jgi:hypothetical protein